MEIIEVDQQDFGNIMPKPYHVFGSAAFAGLNSDKAERIHYLLFRKGKYRLGLTAGIRQDVLLSPFSAPFGGFVFISDDIRLGMLDEAVKLLSDWALQKGLKAVKLIIPPSIYNEKFISKQVNCLYRAGFHIENIDLNYCFFLHKFDHNYPDIIWRNARKNLNIALQGKLSFSKCEQAAEKKLAYEVISQNRDSRGFPLRMSWEQVDKTTRLIPAGFFLVRNEKETPIAAAIVFHVSPKIGQVVYWGDLPGTGQYKTMNFLSYRIFEFYKNAGLEMLDLGPSTENSIPNTGLCEFKESIGCDINMKYTLLKDL